MEGLGGLSFRATTRTIEAEDPKGLFSIDVLPHHVRMPVGGGPLCSIKIEFCHGNGNWTLEN